MKERRNELKCYRCKHCWYGVADGSSSPDAKVTYNCSKNNDLPLEILSNKAIGECENFKLSWWRRLLWA